MPVSLSTVRDPFRAGSGSSNGSVARRSPTTLRVPQTRILAVLLPPYPEDPPLEWPLFTRSGLAVRAGYTTLSGTVTRVLNGIRPGSSSGEAHPGLLSLGLVEEIPVDVDGLIEINYRITRAGIDAYSMFVAQGGVLTAVKDASKCINDRYK